MVPGPPRFPSPYGTDPYAPRGAGPQAPADSKAVLSLVLGILSIVLCGLTGIPAIVLGFSAKGDIQRSGGMIGGAGLATGGIVTGIIGTFTTVAAIAMFVVSIIAGAHSVTSSSSGSGPSGSPGSSHHPSHAPRSTGGGHAAAPAGTVHAPSAPVTFGSTRVMDLDPDAKDTFHKQLADEVKRAQAAKQTVIVMTSAKWCTVCREFEDAMTDARMQSALANVSIVRVDIDDFDAELKSEGMLEATLPWFYKIDATLKPIDAISAGEWDENIPENMAPVLKSFVSGTLRARKNPSPMGTSL